MTGAQLGAVDFLTSSFGIAVTGTAVSCAESLGRGQGDEVYTLRQTALLAVSRDGGLTWITQGSALPITGDGPEQIAAVSPSRVWVISPSGQFFATSDGGLSWQRQLPELKFPSVTTADGTVWAAGCRTTALPCAVRIEVTRAPGWHWQARSPNAAGSGRLMSAELRLIPLSATGALLFPLLGPVAGSPVRLLRTSDGGSTWSAVTVPGTAAAPNLAALSVTAGAWFLLSSSPGGMDHAANSVFRSTDGGRNWTVVSADTSAFGTEPAGAPAPVDATALAAASPRRVWLANSNGLQVSGDGGVTWRDVPGVKLAGAGDFASFDVLNATHAWLLGWLGGLWRTTDGLHWQLT